MIIIFDSYSDVGGRENNEDAVLTLSSGGEYLFTVADGLGGHDCGEVASGIAVQILKEAFLRSSPAAPFDCENALEEANRAIIEEQRRTGKKMRTTAATVLIRGGRAEIAHTGDSRVYLFRQGRMFMRTLDHSAAQIAVVMGQISPDEIRRHPDRNVLTRVLGGTDELRADITGVDLCAGDALLICADGFWEHVTEEQMADALEKSKDPAKWLERMRDIRQRTAPGRSDNHSAAAVYVIEK